MSADESQQDKAETEEEKAEEKRSVSAYVVYRSIVVEGEEELERSAWALSWSGLAAGLSISFSVVAEAALAHHLPKDAAWTPLVSKLGYSVGFLIVVLGRQQLFTENTLTPVLPLLRDRDRHTLLRLLRLWTIVFVTNMLGTILFAFALAHLPMFDHELRDTLTDMARHAAELPFWDIFVRAIFAGWLLAMMVWLLPVAESGRIAVIVILTYVIGIAQFSHVVAGSTEVFYLAARGLAGWWEMTTHFIVPATLGNTLGGVAMVAALNYAQAVDDKKDKK